MADILRSYEQQFGIICADIMSNISRASSSTSDKSSSVTLIENLFQEASEIIEQMDLEIRDINSAIKRTPEEKDKYTNIIKSYKKELSKLESEFNKQVKSTGSKRSNFEIQLNDDDDDETDLNELRRESQKGSSNLERGYKIVLETEETGNNILSDLFGQREQITRSRDRMREANVNLGKSSRVLGDMARRVLQNKLVLIGMCFILFLFLGFMVYYVVKK